MISKYESCIPVSPAQLEIWLSCEIAGSAVAFNIPLKLTIVGLLDVNRLVDAFKSLMNRHSTLRMSLDSIDASLFAVTTANLEPPIEFEDYSSLVSEERESKVKSLETSVAEHEFDLAAPPLFIARVAKISTEEHRLFLTVHHTIADGSSIGLFIDQLFELYYSPDIQDNSEFNRTYIDFVKRVNEEETSKEGIKNLQAIAKKLNGAPPLNICSAKHRSSRTSGRGAIVGSTLSMEFVDRLRICSSKHNATPFQFLLSGFYAALMRFSNQRDIVVGMPVSLRDRPSLSRSIGDFLNTIVVRVAMNETDSFLQLLKEVRASVLSALDSRYTSFESIVRSVGDSRSQGKTPIFQTMFVLQTLPTQTMYLEDLKIEPEQLHNGRAKADLTLEVAFTEEGASLTLEYRSCLFDKEVAESFLSAYCALVDAAIQVPTTCIDVLPTLAQDDQHLLIEKWNATSASLSETGVSLLDMLRSQASINPESPAVIFDSEEPAIITFAELDDRASKLAVRLGNEGVEAGSVVAICMERSVDLIVGLIGIVHARGAFLLIDPEWPSARIAQVFAEAGCNSVLVHSETDDRIPSQIRKLPINGDWSKAMQIVNPAKHENLAYVVFTSGSTGRPKGAMISNEGLLNRLLWMRNFFDVTNTDAVLHKTPVGFDVCIWEFFLPLITGARLIVARPNGHRDPAYIADVICRHSVSILHFVPSMLRLFLDYPHRRSCESVRWVVSSGEELAVDLQNRAIDYFESSLANLYGPAEAAIDVTLWECKSNDGRRIVPIGRPAPNCYVYVLDRLLQPVALGIQGELYLGGIQIGLGYLNQPGLTAESFVYPMRQNFPKVLYKTGDIGRQLTCGNFVFEGRRDDQVKFNGQRIELGEIASICRAHDDIADAVAVISNNELSVYVVPMPGIEVATEQVVGWLSTHLPPSITVNRASVIDEIPISANGKLDRRRLPEAKVVVKARQHVAPQSQIEKQMASAWSSVLRQDPIGVYDNFFELGGDSMRMIQVLSLLAKNRIELSASEFYEHPTIAKLATCCRTIETDREVPKKFELVSEIDRKKLSGLLEDAYPLSRIQTSLLLFVEEHDLYRSYYTSYRIGGNFQIDAINEALQIVVSRHPLLRASVDRENFTEPLVLVHKNAKVQITVCELEGISEESVSEVVRNANETNAQRPFDWQTPPLLRVFVYRTNFKEWHLTLVEPWLDGWSVAIVGSELLTAYASILNSEIVNFSNEPSVLHNSFLASERKELRSQYSRDFWQKHLANAPDGSLYLASKTDKRKGPFRSTVQLPSDLLLRLEEVAATASLPLKTLLLAAHLWVLRAQTGRAEVITSVMFNGRPDIEGGAGIVGLFLNPLPFRFAIGNESWIDLARKVFENEKVLYSHRLYPASQINVDVGGITIDSLFNFTDFHPYRDIIGREDFRLIDVNGSDQTYFEMTAQFSVDLRRNLHLSLEFSFEEPCSQRVKSLRGSYLRALTAIAASPQAENSSIDSIAEFEQRWRRPRSVRGKDHASQNSIGDLFTFQAKQTPNKTAIIDADKKIDFSQLESASNQLAHYLISQGVREGSRILVLGDRSLETVLAFLGIMKAGAEYIPLEKGAPKAQVSTIFEAARIDLTIATYCKGIDDDGMVHLPEIAPILAAQPVTSPRVSLGKKALAYTMFTSGSTGEPKGVSVSHGAVLNRLRWMWNEFPFLLDDVLGFRTPLGFVDSVWELYGGLLKGVPIVILPTECSIQADKLEAAIDATNITRLALVPTILKRLLDDGFGSSAKSPASRLRVLTVSGEPFPASIAQEVRGRFPGTTLINLYGSTEVSADVTYHVVETECQNAIVPIGKPIDNTVLYVVGDNFALVPDGIPGELLVGGENLAEGYLGREDLTSDRFVANPFGTFGKLFRTGDLVRYGNDGSLHFLGRIDRQLKIRGVRVEPAQVEAAVCAHPEVRAAAVVATQDFPSRLLCYVETSIDSYAVSLKLRRFLLDQLTTAMIPDQFIAVSELPLNSSGKIDRSKLQVNDGQSRQYIAPEGPVEEELAELWRDLLRLDNLSASDDLFDLGGNSLHVIQLKGRIAAVFGVVLSVRQLFSKPVLRDMALDIETSILRAAGRNPAD